jgi:hypothetical protein
MGLKSDQGDEDVGNIVKATHRQIFSNPDAASTKLVAWAYGCIRKDSEEEAQLLDLLKKKLGAPC